MVLKRCANGEATISKTYGTDNLALYANYNANSERFTTYATVGSNICKPEIYVVSVPSTKTAEFFATTFPEMTGDICSSGTDNLEILLKS